MFLMYVDESGDCGVARSPSSHFVLTGMVVHELRWHTVLGRIIGFRRLIREKFGLKLREEIHAAHLIAKPKDLIRIPRNDRLTIIRHFADLLAGIPDVSVINVVVDKTTKTPDYDVFEKAWRTLIQRFENTLTYRNFPGPANPDERGLIIADHTDDKKLQKLLRRMRRYNPIPHQRRFGQGYRNLPLTSIVEDPFFRRSDHSYFIQAVDLAAYLMYQHENPNTFMKRNGGHRYLRRLEPILCKMASSIDTLGVVRL